MKLLITFAILLTAASMANAGIPTVKDPKPLNAENICMNAGNIEDNMKKAKSNFNTIMKKEFARAEAAKASAQGKDSASGLADIVAGTSFTSSASLAQDQAKLSEIHGQERCNCKPKLNEQGQSPSQEEIVKVQKECTSYVAYLSSKVKSAAVGSHFLGIKSKFAADALKYGAIGGAAVGGYMLLKGGKKDKDKEDELTSEEKNQGVIVLEDGTKIACFSQANFQRSECRSTMISLCQASDKETTGGCNSFNNFHCSNIGEGKDSMYCLYSATASYCNQTGDVIGDSPSCKWRDSRPKEECQADPEAISCRVPIAAAELEAQCGNYPYDPVCKAKDNNIAVTQPSSGVESIDANTPAGIAPNDGISTAGAGNLTVENSTGDNSVDLGDGQGAVSLSSITSNSGSSSSSSVDPSIANLEVSNSQVLSGLCSSGKLLGCPN